MQTYKFYRKETNQWENVIPEKWQWEANYFDGKFLKQFDDNGIFHQFREIEQSSLGLFKMVNSETGKTFTLIFQPQKMKLIHFYRNIVLDARTQDERKIRIYCFGFEKKFLGRTQKTILAIMPNDNLVITDNIENMEVI